MGYMFSRALSCVRPLGPEIDVPADRNLSEAALHRPQLIRPDSHAGLTTHDLHQDPNPAVWRNLFHLSDEVDERPLGQGDLIAWLQ